MSVLKILAVAALLPFSFGSCKKNQPAPLTKTKSQLLTEGQWKLVEAYTNTEKGGVYTTADVFGTMQECEKDNLTIFSKGDYKVTIDEGPAKCNEFDPQTRAYQKWVLVSDTQIELTNILFETSYEATILELTETTLHIRVSGTAGDGTHFENTFKYERS